MFCNSVLIDVSDMSIFLVMKPDVKLIIYINCSNIQIQDYSASLLVKSDFLSLIKLIRTLHGLPFARS